MIYLILIIFFLLLFIAYIYKSNFFSPWMITTSVWTLIGVLSIVFSDILYPLGNHFYSSIIIWVLFFFISSFISSKFSKSKQIYNTPSDKVLDFFLIISILFTPLYLKEIYDNVLENGTGSLFFDLRYQALNSEKDYGILLYLKNFNKALLILEFLRKRLNYKKIIIISIINILVGVSIMEKGTFFFITFIILFFLYHRKTISKKVLFIVLVSFLTLSFTLNSVRSHESSSSVQFVDFFAIYALSPSVAFETLEYKEYSSANFGANTFPFFYGLSNALFGTEFIVEKKMQSFVNVPLPTNVYTVMQPFYEDFGYLGILFFGSLFGTFCGFIYKRSLSSNFFYGVYSYLACLLALQFFQEEFFVSFSVFIQICIILYLPFLLKKIRYK